MKIRSTTARIVIGALSSYIIIFAFAPLSDAQSSSTIAQTFKASSAQGEIVSGLLVSIKNGENTVELTTQETANKLVGVVDGSPLVSLSEGGQGIEVVLSGTAEVLVSDINGVVWSGDKLTISPIAGVAMKSANNSQIIGTAQEGFTPTTTKSISDRGGKRHNIHIGYVRTQIGVTSYQASGSDFLPPFLQNAANSIAGRPVSLIRVLICSILLLLGFIAVIILVYTSTRSAMTSLGRNPLAAPAIRRGLYQILAISLVITGCTLLASYVILTV